MSDKHHEHDEHAEKGHGGSHGGHGGGHGGGHAEGEHEGAPEWLISFADNVTLMMGFFVILLAATLAQVGGGGKGDGDGKGKPGTNSPDMLDAAIAVRAAFNNPVNIDSTDPTDQPLVRRLIERDEEGFSKFPGPKGKEHDVQSIRPGDYKAACGKVPFANGSAELSAEAKEVIAEVAREVRGLRMIIEIRGHASASESFKQDDKGMRLSFDRALLVAKSLAETGVEWRQLRVVACGDNDRLKPQGYGKGGQKPNERVEIIVTQELMPTYTPSAAH